MTAYHKFSVNGLLGKSGRSNLSNFSEKLLSFSENFGNFLSSSPEVVPSFQSFPNYRVFSEEILISKIKQPFRSIRHFSQEN